MTQLSKRSYVGTSNPILEAFLRRNAPPTRPRSYVGTPQTETPGNGGFVHLGYRIRRSAMT